MRGNAQTEMYDVLMAQVSGQGATLDYSLRLAIARLVDDLSHHPLALGPVAAYV